MRKKKIEEEYNKKIQKLIELNKFYYEYNSPKVDDREYDALKNDILQQLQLPKEKLKMYHKKLKEFRYCSDMNDLQYGYYIRWIPLRDPNKVYLTNGATIVDILFENNESHILCRNFKNRFIRIKFDEIIVFQNENRA